MIALFASGQTYATPGALDLGIDLSPYLNRHFAGDWGACGVHPSFPLHEATRAEELTDQAKEDALVNLDALENGGRIMSAYVVPHGRRVWVITDGVWPGGKIDLSTVTTCLLPSEY